MQAVSASVVFKSKHIRESFTEQKKTESFFRTIAGRTLALTSHQRNSWIADTAILSPNTSTIWSTTTATTTARNPSSASNAPTRALTSRCSTRIWNRTPTSISSDAWIARTRRSTVIVWRWGPISLNFWRKTQRNSFSQIQLHLKKYGHRRVPDGIEVANGNDGRRSKTPEGVVPLFNGFNSNPATSLAQQLSLPIVTSPNMASYASQMLLQHHQVRQIDVGGLTISDIF